MGFKVVFKTVEWWWCSNGKEVFVSRFVELQCLGTTAEFGFHSGNIRKRQTGQ